MCSPGVGGDQPGEVLDAVGAGSSVGDERLLDRLARVERLELRQLPVAVAHDLGRSSQNPTALGGRCRRPDRQTGTSCVDRAVDHGFVGRPQAGDHRPIGGVDALEPGPVAIDELPVDEVAALRLRLDCRAAIVGI